MKTVYGADLFCGGGGMTAGAKQACVKANLKANLLAINHWPVAIETHSANHPEFEHMCESLDSIDPRKAVPRGRLDFLIAAPECTHHSNARGGRPMSDQSRASAWHVLRWADALHPEAILIENVREFMSWSPLGRNGRPMKSRKGETFQAFLQSLRSLGYKVDYRVLNAADYGDPTTRERLFIMARRSRGSIPWPIPTHTPTGERMVWGTTEPWQAARNIIDWSIPGQSIFNRKRPLSETTLARIAAGLKKFGGAAAEPFLVILRGTDDRRVKGSPRSVDRPLPTVTGSGAHFGLCEPVPFILPQFGEAAPRSVDRPLGTITTTSRGIGLVQPFLVPYRGEREGQEPRCHSVDKPLPTATTINGFALCEPFMMSFREGEERRCHSVEEPMPTLTTQKQYGLVEPFIVPLNHGKDDKRSYSMDRPMPTVTSVDAWGIVEPSFLVNYNGNGRAHSVDEPLDTVTTTDRFGLVELDGMQLDIRFRMLQPHELAAAMSFPGDYKFAGNREQKVRQIGNAVPVKLATALCEGLLECL